MAVLIERIRQYQGITNDSRQVRPGYVFVAIRGFRQDGHSFIDEAAARGAGVVVYETPQPLPEGVEGVAVADGRRALALLSSRFYREPSRDLSLVGITGTNGKTTVSHLVESIFRVRPQKTGMIGTIHNKIGDRILPAIMTTPESVELQALLRQMVDEGVQSVVMEVSSHALELERVTGCAFDAAVLTNIRRDHFDFHQDFPHYLRAKLRLFQGVEGGELPRGPRVAVINQDDPAAAVVAGASTHSRVLRYGFAEGSDVTAREPQFTAEGTRFVLVTPAGEVPVYLPLPGRFNVVNALAAAATGLGLGYSLEEVALGLSRAPQVPGRCEQVAEGQPYQVMVDYAHNPDGLENILELCRQLARGRVISVFGGRGERDRGKRPMMGEVAGRLADLVVLTTDSPYSEDPATIAEEIAGGIRAVGGRHEVVLDRRQAIRHAISLAESGDLVVITGRGHERTQVFGNEPRVFSDRQEAEGAIRERMRLSGLREG